MKKLNPATNMYLLSIIGNIYGDRVTNFNIIDKKLSVLYGVVEYFYADYASLFA